MPTMPGVASRRRLLPRDALRLAVLAVRCSAGIATRAQAIEEIRSPRALGMGDALRAFATGSTALHLNPSGLLLVRNYSAEGAFTFGDGLEHIDLSISDTVTS